MKIEVRSCNQFPNEQRPYVSKYWKLLTLTSLVACLCPSACRPDPAANSEADRPSIDLWYGDEQSFGHLGNPQRQINILGNVSSPSAIIDLHYSLNSADPVALSIGSDLHRLAAAGDFNVELEVSDLHDGTNELVITAVAADSLSTRRRAKIQYIRGKFWPLPYTVRWDQVREIQQVVQVVDGKWKLTRNGIRTLDPYYDRVLAMGDATWKDYEVTTSVIFHDFTPPQKGPPTYNVSHAAIATRWPGHDFDEHQPNRKWYPLGATAEFRLTARLDRCRWRVFDGENLYEEDMEKLRVIDLGVSYMMKHRVETLPDETTRYSVKLWTTQKEEPANWDLTALEPIGNLLGGSALLIAHNADVTFGDVFVCPLGETKR